MVLTPSWVRGLTTAEILYRRPDHLWLLQTFVWQDYDVFPEFPGLVSFLHYWEAELDGPLYAVTVCHARLVRAVVIDLTDGEFKLS